MLRFSLVYFLLFCGYGLMAQCGYELVWSDEFSGTSLDQNNWSYQTGASGWGNNELQDYTNTNAQLTLGRLKIIADEPTPNYYTSSRIRSKELFDIKYGKIEARIKLPKGQGIWPAFWMLPTCNTFGIWPTSGEIDIMEYLGHQVDRTYVTCHYGESSNNKGQSGNTYILPNGDFSTAFHVFAVEWSENNIKWTIDGNLVHQVNSTQVAPFLWPFNESFHLLLNVAVGGNWPGSPDNTTVFPAVMEVDYVRAYQKIDEIEIQGQTEILAPSSSVIYTAPNIAGATYYWYLPNCITGITGQGTNQISVDWINDGGQIQLVMVLNCQTIIRSIDINVSSNLFTNSGFEKGFQGWNSFFNNGAQGNFELERNSTHTEVQSACIEVNSLGQNFWDVQFSQSAVSVLQGEVYNLSFYAKADQNTRQIRIDFRNIIGNVSTDNVILNLTNSWQLYQYQYTVPYNIAGLVVDFNHGFETGAFCYDEVRFEKNGTNHGLCANNFCVNSLDFPHTPIDDGYFSAAINIDSKSIINSSQNVDFRAGDEILLEIGFEALTGCNFTADIESCDSN